MSFEYKRWIMCCVGSILIYSALILNNQGKNYSYILKIPDENRQITAWISSTQNVGNWTIDQHNGQYFKNDVGKIDLRLAPGMPSLQNPNYNIVNTTTVLTNTTSEHTTSEHTKTTTDQINNKQISGTVSQDVNTSTETSTNQENQPKAPDTTKPDIVQDITTGTINSKTPQQNQDTNQTTDIQTTDITNQKNIFQKFRQQSIAQATSWSLIMKLRDGQYNDGHAYIINMSYGEANFLPDKTKIKFTSDKFVYPINPYYAFGNMNRQELYKKVNNYALVREYESFSFTKSYTCMMDITLEFLTTRGTLLMDIETKKLEGTMKIKGTNQDGKLCFPDLTVDLTRMQDDLTEKSARYSIYQVAIAQCVLFISIKILNELMEDLNTARKYSQISIVIIMSIDLFISWTHFIMGLSNSNNFQYFLFPSVLFFMIYSVMDLRQIGLIWTFNNQRALDSMSFERRRQATFSFNCKVYLAQFFGFIVQSHYILEPACIVVLSLVFLPQIINNVLRGQFITFDLDYYLLFLCSRFLVYFYHKGCPENLLEMGPQYITCIISVVILVVSMNILWCQSLQGPQFIVPPALRREIYNYFIKKPIKDPNVKEEDQLNCAICLEEIYKEAEIPFDVSIIDKPHIKKLNKMQKSHIMKTPCNHQFHIQCLVNWMQMKLECPSCRKELTPIFQK